MDSKERTFNAFRICITDRKCQNTDCPYEYECEKVNNGQIQIPKVLALDVMQLLKDQQKEIEERTNEAAAYAELLIKHGYEFT